MIYNKTVIECLSIYVKIYDKRTARKGVRKIQKVTMVIFDQEGEKGS